MLSLKISNVVENPLELLQRLRGFQSPGKKNLVNGIKNNDWRMVFTELVYRFELYVEAKILNYKRKDAEIIVSTIIKFGHAKFVDALMVKFAAEIEELAVMNESFDFDAFMQNLNEAENSDDEDAKASWITKTFYEALKTNEDVAKKDVAKYFEAKEKEEGFDISDLSVEDFLEDFEG